MDEENNFWRRNRDTLIYFGIPALLFSAILSFLLLNYNRKDLHLMLNQHHNIVGDHIFVYATYLAGGYIVLLAVLLAFFKYRYAILALLTLLVNLLITNGLKSLFGNPRPKFYFEQNFPDIALSYVKGVNMYTTYSFPSGHTSAAFAFMLIVALSFKEKAIKLTAVFIAMMIGYSRTYLSQHFADDVLFGSFVGIFSAILTSFIFYKLSFTKAEWMDKFIITYFK